METDIKHVDTVIIGAGITGLACASFLQNNDYLIIEKEKTVGGYCKSTIRNGFVWDYSGHFFHFNNESIKNYLLENVDTEVIQVDKKITKIWYNGEYIDFPFQYNIQQLPCTEFIECLYDLYHTPKKPINSFKDYVYTKLGTSIAEKFIIPYNEKLYGCDLNTLDVDSMGRFFPSITSFDELLEILVKKKHATSYNDTFIYPRFGVFEFIKSLLTRIDNDKIITNTPVSVIDLEKKTVKTPQTTYHFDTLINTVPFDVLYKLCGFDVPQQFSYSKTVVFNLGFDTPSDIAAHWVYFPGKEVFYRVGFYDNILATNRMSLYVEIGLSSDTVVDEQILLSRVLDDLKKCGIIKVHKLVDYEMITMSPAYVHITKESKRIYDTWSSIYNKQNIYSIGRYGSWTYCSIEDNIIQAKTLTDTLNSRNAPVT